MYSESERPWLAWAFVIALRVCVVIYAVWEWRIVAQGWDPAGVVTDSLQPDCRARMSILRLKSVE